MMKSLAQQNQGKSVPCVTMDTINGLDLILLLRMPEITILVHISQ